MAGGWGVAGAACPETSAFVGVLTKARTRFFRLPMHKSTQSPSVHAGLPEVEGLFVPDALYSQGGASHCGSLFGRVRTP